MSFFKTVIFIVEIMMWRVSGYGDRVDFDDGCSMQLSVFELISIDRMQLILKTFGAIRSRFWRTRMRQVE